MAFFPVALLAIASVARAVAPTPHVQVATTPTQVNISLPIDHFDSTNTRVYSNRYWYNDVFYKPGGPVFLYDIGEGPGDDDYAAAVIGPDSSTFISGTYELAKRHNGMMVVWEHRYYGYSLPCPIGPEGIANVSSACQYQYLSMDQALEDVVYFANHPNFPKYNQAQLSKLSATNSPWVFIGGSYPGARAAWARVRNPETFYSSWASSAVVGPIEDGSSYFNTQARLRQSNCTADMNTAINYIDSTLTSNNQTAVEDMRIRVVTAIEAFGTSSPPTKQATTADADSYTLEDLTPYLVSEYDNYFQAAGPTPGNEFCDFLETFDLTQAPAGASITTILKNKGNAAPASSGLRSGKNASPQNVANAFIWAAWKTSNILVNSLKARRDAVKGSTNVQNITTLERLKRYAKPLPSDPRRRRDSSTTATTTSDAAPASGYGDGTSWLYQVQSQFGVYEASSPAYFQYQANSIALSHFENLTTTRGFYYDFFADSGIKNVPQHPNITACTKYGGWKMNPSNVMFTAGQWDPWAPFTPLSVDTEIGAPGRRPTTSVPKCGVAPDANTPFGAVWEETGHAADLFGDPSKAPGKALELFDGALKAWLPCFKARG